MTADWQTVSSVRLTASRRGNAPKRGVWRISARISVAVTLVLAASITYGASDDKSKPGIRIIPAPRHRLPAPAAPPSPNEPGVNHAAPAAAQPSAGASSAQQPTVIPALPSYLNPSHLNYYEIWRTIPFSHAEYAANPGYRNQATLGLLFNTMPITQIIQQGGNQPSVQQYGYITPYQYNRLDGRSSMSYNFFYPHPSVYRQY